MCPLLFEKVYAIPGMLCRVCMLYLVCTTCYVLIRYVLCAVCHALCGMRYVPPKLIRTALTSGISA